MKPRASVEGFTLLELGVVLLVLSILVGGVMSVMTQSTRAAKNNEAKMKIDAIEEALLNFSKLYARIPCPANGTVLMTAAGFGAEAANPGTCTGAFTDGSNTVGGVVPIRALGLPDEYMFDPWGGRFSYVADKRATGTNAFSVNNPAGYGIYNTAIGSIIADDSAGNPRTTCIDSTGAIRHDCAVAAIISHGINGHGAFQLSGVRKSVGSNNTHELANCHCDADGVTATFGNTVYQETANTPVAHAGDVTWAFDDIVRYYMRGAFISSDDTVTEK